MDTLDIALLSLLILSLGIVIGYFYGLGELSQENLKINAIYETVSAAAMNDGKYAVILRNQNGDLIAYILNQNPPKVFKVTEDLKNPYELYPS